MRVLEYSCRMTETEKTASSKSSRFLPLHPLFVVFSLRFFSFSPLGKLFFSSLLSVFNNTTSRGRNRTAHGIDRSRIMSRAVLSFSSILGRVRGPFHPKGGNARGGGGEGKRGQSDRCRSGGIQIFARMPAGSITTFIILTTYVVARRHLYLRFLKRGRRTIHSLEFSAR